MGWAYSTRCEIQEVLLRNLKWLGGYRRPPAALHKYGPSLIKAATDSISIGKAIKAVGGLPTVVRPVLFHLLWSGVLELDLYARMTDETPISLSAIGRKSCH